MQGKYYFSCETHAEFMCDPRNFFCNTKVSAVSRAKFSWKDHLQVNAANFMHHACHLHTKNSHVIPTRSMQNPHEFGGFVMWKKWNTHAGQLKIGTFPQTVLYKSLIEHFSLSAAIATFQKSNLHKHFMLEDYSTNNSIKVLSKCLQ